MPLLYEVGEISLYFSLTITLMCLCFLLATSSWLKAGQARAQDQFNQIEWEQQRQQAARMDDSTGDLPVHKSTADFYRLDDGDDV